MGGHVVLQDVGAESPLGKAVIRVLRSDFGVEQQLRSHLAQLP